MSSYVFAMAAAYENIENGLGYTLIDPQGRFFCGFEQDDGSLVFDAFRQEPQAGGTPTASALADKVSYAKDKPVFLAPQEMADKGLGAAAYGIRSFAVMEDDLAKEVHKECKVGIVRKDLTYRAEDFADISWSNLPTSRSGLASSEACANAKLDGYVSLRKEFASQVEQVKRTIRKLFGPSKPSI